MSEESILLPGDMQTKQTMRFATSINTLGRRSINYIKRDASIIPRNFHIAQRSQTAHRWLNKDIRSLSIIADHDACRSNRILLAASAALALSIISQANNQSQYAECSALPATPTNDINTIYKIVEVIGEGGYGQVFHAICLESGKPVALKCIPKEWTEGHEFQREIDVLQKLNSEYGGNPHICKMYSIYEAKDDYCVAMELIEGGELFEHLIAEGAYSEAKAAMFMRQFAEGLAFMHKTGVAHGDLKPENLLLSSWDNEEAELKLVDFGCAIESGKHKAEGTSQSTLGYDAPEKVINHSPPTYESDIWAAGCILYIILAGTHPFDKSGTATDDEIAELVKGIGESEDKLSELIFDERTKGLSPSAISLLRRMLHPDPKKRITSEQLRRNRWVQGLTASWDTLEGIDGKLEAYWQKEFQNRIFKKFGGGLTEEHLRSVFTSIDEDGNGSIDIEELTKALLECGSKPQHIQSIFDSINLDHDKGISFEEFSSALKNELPIQAHQEALQKRFRNIIAKEIQSEDGTKLPEPAARRLFNSKLRRLFNSMDLDHNGSLDAYELRLLLRKLSVDEKDISMLMASVDLDKDGSLSFDEFSKVMFGARSK